MSNNTKKKKTSTSKLESTSSNQPSKNEVLLARHALWRDADLSWKLEPHQKELYDSYYNLAAKGDKIVTWVAHRRSGKSFVLLILAIEHCLRSPKTVIKYAAPRQEQVREILDEILPTIFADCPKELMPEFKERRNTWFFPNGSKMQLVGVMNKSYNKLRGGCLTGDTNVMTPNGPKLIKNMQIGDEIYGYNKDGTVSLTTVKNVFDNGIKEVTELFWKNKYIGSATDDHVFMTNSLSSLWSKKYKPIDVQKKLKDIKTKNSYFTRRLIDIPGGRINEKNAYILGAMIGDGLCTHSSTKTLLIASKDNKIPDYIAKLLNRTANYEGNYKYTIKTSNTERYKHSDRIKLNYYFEWLYEKNFLTKNFDWKIVDTWNRTSCMKLLAGLIDTDGNVHFHKKEGTLEISYNSSNYELLKNIQKLIYKYFNYYASISKDSRCDRTSKYTCPHYRIRIRSSFTSIRILKNITKYLQSEQKKIKPEYLEFLKPKERNNSLRLTKGRKYLAPTYDIEVNNDTNLYLLHEGIVTHNSSQLAILDESGFMDDLGIIVRSVMMPTTTTTNGKILLATTPPDEADHEFMEFYEDADAKGNLVIKTIEDYFKAHDRVGKEPSRITRKEIQETINSYPNGARNPSYRREYLCEPSTNKSLQVIPEFTMDKQQNIIKEWERPKFFDAYTGMDIGTRDLTAVVFGYYDFARNKIIIEDEFSISGEDMTTNKVAVPIIEKENELWPHSIYKRVADNNNLILLNDMDSMHGLKFEPTDKREAQAAINHVRMLIDAEQIIIHPRCKTLINHIKFAKWNKEKTMFARSRKHYHYDMLSALIYLVRNVDTKKNPYPEGYLSTFASDNLFVSKSAKKKYGNQSNIQDLYKSMFQVKKPSKI